MPEDLLCCELAESRFRERQDELRWAVARLPIPGDTEAVHDVRVALRRLREAYRGFASCLASRQPHSRADLRQAERRLGPMRDAQVRLDLLEEVLGPVAVWRDRSDDPAAVPRLTPEVIPGERRRLRPGLRGLEMEARRALADATADEIESQRVRVVRAKSIRRLQELAEPVRLQPRHKGAQMAEALAGQELPKLFRRAERPGGRDGLHQRRIAMRRLRYRVELFAPVLSGGHRVVLDELRRVQNILGRFHDLAVLAAWVQASERRQPHELRAALRRLAVRVELEEQAAEEAAAIELLRLDEAGWWQAARIACLG